MNDSNYRKYNDGSHNSSKYHKLDGTPIRAILKREAEKEVKDFEKNELKELTIEPKAV
jgi:hypothetical protein